MHLRRTFLHPDVQAQGCTRIEVSLYACRGDLSADTAKEVVAEALALVSPSDLPEEQGLFVAQPPAKQWVNLAVCLCHRDLLLEEVPVGRRFHVRRGLSILTGRNQEEKSVGRVTEGRRGIAPAEVFAGWQVERLLGVLWIWGWGLQERRLPSSSLLGLQLRLVLLLFFGQSLEGGQALGVWGGNEPYRVPRDLAASLDWNTWPDLSRSPAPRACQHQWEEARRLSSYICPCPTLRRWPTHRVPFRAPALPTYHKQLLGNCRNLLLFCNSATQLSVPLLRGNVCIRGRAICDHWVCPPLCLIGCAGCLRSRRAATFLHICISPISGHQLGKALHLFGSSALSRVVAVLPLVEPKHVAASIRQAADMLETLFAVPGQELRDCAALCNFGHLLEVEGRDLYANRMALVGPPNPRNQGRGQQEDSGVGTVWMQLCRWFASCQDCACIGVLGIASERSQLLVGSQNVHPEDGSAAAHSTALFQVSSLSTFALVGRTQTPETRPVVMCVYQAMNIDPCSRSARTRHQ